MAHEDSAGKSLARKAGIEGTPIGGIPDNALDPILLQVLQQLVSAFQTGPTAQAAPAGVPDPNAPPVAPGSTQHVPAIPGAPDNPNAVPPAGVDPNAALIQSIQDQGGLLATLKNLIQAIEQNASSGGGLPPQ